MAKAQQGIAFICVGNSARSQMAEGLARTLAPPGIPIFSAGSKPCFVHALAVRAMAEIGIDLGHHYSKHIDTLPLDQIDTIITLCAEEMCPTLPEGIHHLHWPHDDPSFLGQTEAEQLDAFRRVRDQLQARIAAFFQERSSTGA